MADDPHARQSRSISIGPTAAQYVRSASKHQIDSSKSQVCHLISCNLWEAISGEKLSPARLCQIQEMYLPQIAGSGFSSSQSSQQSVFYVKMAKDRHDCIGLQEQISRASAQELEVIFNALYPSMSELVVDGSANFVIQKLCEHLTAEQQTLLLQFFLEDIQKIVDQPNGCRVLQRFIETTTRQNIDVIFLALKSNFVQLCSSQNGNHIAQRFIINLPDRVPAIIDSIKGHVVKLVLDNWGCRVIQQLFDRLNIDCLIPLVNEVLTCAASLATNQFGNYVVQNILSSGTSEHISALIKSFSGHFFEFSMHKFASNVIEKCIRKSDKKQQNEIFTEIIGVEGSYKEDRILKMIADQFGNYVIQRIIEYGTDSQQAIISTIVDEHYDFLVKCSYAKHVISCLENIGFRF